MKKVHVLLTAIICVCIAIVPAAAQNRGDFKLQVSTSGDTIKVKCTEGCGFTDIFYVAKENTAVAVDYNGKTEVKTSVKAAAGKDFLFTIQQTSNGMTLNGIRGVAWETLNVNCRRECRKWVDETGIVVN